jgi:hypothetical protein
MGSLQGQLRDHLLRQLWALLGGATQPSIGAHSITCVGVSQ